MNSLRTCRKYPKLWYTQALLDGDWVMPLRNMSWTTTITGVDFLGEWEISRRLTTCNDYLRVVSLYIVAAIFPCFVQTMILGVALFKVGPN